MNRPTIQRIYALSPLQEGILFHTLSSPNSATYFEQFSFTLNVEIDFVSLERAWQTVIDRHDVLRSSFHWKELGKPLQVVHKPVKLPFERQDWSALSSVAQQDRLRAFLQADRERGFDLAVAPLMRMVVIRLGPSAWQFVISFHHVLLDGWSVAIVFSEASACYEAYTQGHEPQLEQPRPFEDYIAWIQQKDFTKAEAFWREVLAGHKGPEPIAGDRAAGMMPVPGEPYDSHQTTLSKETTVALQNLARAHQLTVNTLMQGAWALLLSRYMNDDDVVFGATGSGRPVELKGIESIVGLFINTLPVRVKVENDRLLIPWLKDLQARQLEARQFEHTPLVDVQGWSQVPRGAPLFETIVGFENYPMLSSAGEVATGVQLGDVFERTNYPLSLIISPTAEINIVLLYVSSRFQRKSVERLLAHFQNFLEAMATDPHRRIADFPCSSPDEQYQLEVQWNQTEMSYAKEVCVHELFEKWALETPNAPAVSCSSERLSYAELNQRANRIAQVLRRKGVQVGSPVAICLERSCAMVAAVLAVVKAGAAYVPLDPAYPKKSLSFMLRDSGAAVLITTRKVAERIPSDVCELLFLDSDEIAISPPINPSAAIHPGNLAYIIYTSGSTGRPRGVEVQHQSLMNLIGWHHREYAVTAADRASQVAGFAFDASVWETWPYLTAGASIHVVDDATRNTPGTLIDCLAAEGVTLSFLPTALAEMSLDEPLPASLRLRQLLTGGDKLHRAPRPGLPFRLVNHYGPTENTVVATATVVGPDEGATPAIGRPIGNVRVYVVDSKDKLAPCGVAGELCIAGDSLANGYHNLPALTAAKFVPNPFGRAAGERLYRTGDRVRYREDGNLEFLGRLDAQVKLRGFRVEPGEVETVLAQHPAVRKNVVVTRNGEQGGPRLVAYLVAHSYNGNSAPAADAPWEHEQVGRWKQIYDETYRHAEDVDPKFNIIGWNSSYTGEPLSADEMREQIEATVARIRALRPQRVLEIGCGTGLLLFRLAPECVKYWATDFSAAAVEQLKTHLGGLSPVTVWQAEADDFSKIETGAFDLVLINSVVQYFPAASYLERVLRGAVRAVRPGGHVFIGDVRSLELLEAFHASVEVTRGAAGARREDIRKSVQRRLRQEPELVIGSEWFNELAARVPEITAVETQIRRGWSANELTSFRYDVWLEVQGAVCNGQPDELPWERVQSLANLQTHLSVRKPDALVIRGVPNGRVESALAALEWLRSETESDTVGASRQQWMHSSSDKIEPEAIWEMAGALGFEAHIGWGETDETIDVLLEKPQSITAPVAGGWQRTKKMPTAVGNHTNNPQRSGAGQQLIPALRDFLRERLPEHMVPSAFVIMDALPLTPNGKVDRKNLPAPDTQRDATASKGFVAPRTKVEGQIARVWQEVLGIDTVGVHDNFFDLGGHSLLMVRTHGRLTEIFKGDLSIVDLLRYPTVASLAGFVAAENDQTGPAVQTVVDDRAVKQRAAFARQRPVST